MLTLSSGHTGCVAGKDLKNQESGNGLEMAVAYPNAVLSAIGQTGGEFSEVISDSTTCMPAEIDAIRKLVDSSLSPEPWPYMQPGQSVYVQNGPLRGVVGTLLTIKNVDRLVISVTLLQRSVAVEIDRTWAAAALKVNQ